MFYRRFNETEESVNMKIGHWTLFEPEKQKPHKIIKKNKQRTGDL